MHKRYHALVHGDLRQQGPITMPLRVARHHPARVEVASSDQAGVRTCSLIVQPLARFTESTLVAVDLETGFLHQIRVMLAALGHPVVGDARYGRELEADRRAGRLMLHARTLACDLCWVQCPWPEAFRSAVRAARGHAA
jgi:23S rRNA-/tRNA-specific pseudouridylate synthase